jgi:hypothetical protein
MRMWWSILAVFCTSKRVYFDDVIVSGMTALCHGKFYRSFKKIISCDVSTGPFFLLSLCGCLPQCTWQTVTKPLEIRFKLSWVCSSSHQESSSLYRYHTTGHCHTVRPSGRRLWPAGAYNVWPVSSASRRTSTVPSIGCQCFILLLFRWVSRYVHFIYVFLWLVPTGGC